MNHKNMDLLLINILVMIGAILAASNSQLIWIRGPIGIFVTLIVPGYILFEILFPRTSVTGFERITLITVLGMSFLAVVGLLTFIGVGDLRLETWILILVGMTLLGSAIIIFQRRQNGKLKGPAAQADDEQDRPARRRITLPFVARWLPFALALAIVVGSMLYAQSIAQVNPRTEVIQMWMIPDPKNSAHAVQIGVITENAIPHSYSIQLKRGNHEIKVWTAVRLQSSDRWQATVTLPTSLPGTGPLEADLVNPSSSVSLIRQVTLWPETQ